MNSATNTVSNFNFDVKTFVLGRRAVNSLLNYNDFDSNIIQKKTDSVKVLSVLY
jgi:hypothetical protein